MKKVIMLIIVSLICILFICLFCPLVHPMRFQSSEINHVSIRSDCFGSEKSWELDSKDAGCIAEVVEILNEIRMSYFEKYFLSYESGNMTPEMTMVLYHGKKHITIDCYDDIFFFEKDFSKEGKTDGQHKFQSVDRFAGKVNEIIKKYGEKEDSARLKLHKSFLKEEIPSISKDDGELYLKDYCNQFPKGKEYEKLTKPYLSMKSDQIIWKKLNEIDF